MLKFVEDLLHEVRKLRRETEDIVVSGSVKNMEHYRHLMGRLEGYTFVEQIIQDALRRENDS